MLSCPPPLLLRSLPLRYPLFTVLATSSLSTLLLLRQHLPPQNILHNPQIPILRPHRPLNIRQILVQVFYFPFVERGRCGRGFTDVVPGADVDEDGVGFGGAGWDVQGGC